MVHVNTGANQVAFFVLPIPTYSACPFDVVDFPDQVTYWCIDSDYNLTHQIGEGQLVMFQQIQWIGIGKYP